MQGTLLALRDKARDIEAEYNLDQYRTLQYFVLPR